MILIETIRTNNFFVSASSISSFVACLVPGFVANVALNSITSLILDSVTSYAPTFVNDSTFRSVTISAPCALAGRITFIIMNLKTTFFYNKQVTVEDYTSSKLYIKRIIWVKRILFNKTTNSKNYILGILDKIY